MIIYYLLLEGLTLFLYSPARTRITVFFFFKFDSYITPDTNRLNCDRFSTQTMNDALNARQNNMTQLNDNYKALVTEGDRCNLSVPSQLQDQVAALNADWESIQRLAAELSHMPLDISMEDVASKQGRL